jgi:hypothetical protein
MPALQASVENFLGRCFNWLKRSDIARIIGLFHVQINQCSIVRAARASKVIYLKPSTPDVSVFYHYILDLLLPLTLLLAKTSSDVLFVLDHFELFAESLLDLFPDRVRIKSSSSYSNKAKPFQLVGMSPYEVSIRPRSVELFRDDIFTRLGIAPSPHPNKIILIERLPVTLEQSAISDKKRGALRRSITNHSDLESLLAGLTNYPLKFCNLRLEHLSFEDEVCYFRDASVLIAQHGSGLTNCLWMNPGSFVIELTWGSAPSHFVKLCKLKKHFHYQFTILGPHAEVDLRRLSQLILKTPKLREAFGLV